MIVLRRLQVIRMTNFKSIKSKNIDELAEWLDKHGEHDGSAWSKWFDENYCRKCESEYVYVEMFKKKLPCAWCEIHGKCKYFQDMSNIPDTKQIIKMWLETEEVTEDE